MKKQFGFLTNLFPETSEFIRKTFQDSKQKGTKKGYVSAIKN